MAWSDAARAAALEARRRNAKGRQVTLYHGTSAVAARAIEKEGLRPGAAHNYSKSYYKGARSGSVFLTSDRRDAVEHAMNAMQKMQDRLIAQAKRGKDVSRFARDVFKYAVVKVSVPASSLKQDRLGASYQHRGTVSPRSIKGVQRHNYSLKKLFYG